MKMGQKTILIIAHRLSTIKNCANIIVLLDGKVAETGDHSTLLEGKGAYSKLVERQI